MAFPPMDQGSTFPLLILSNHAPSQFGCNEHSWLGYLIKDAYLHDEKLDMYASCPDISSVTISIQNIE